MSGSGRDIDDITEGSQTQNIDSMDTDGATASCTSKGKRLKSSVWQNMNREVLDDGSIKATCNFCKKSFSASPAGGTSHLKRHVDTCVARQYRNIRNYCIAPSLPESGPVLRNPSVNSEEVRRALCLFVISGAHPFSIIEEPGFKYMISTMCPQFNPISRRTLKRDALVHYEEEKKLVEIELRNAPGRICFTSNNWRSEHTSDEYMCITAHWIDCNWCLQKRVIKFAALTHPFDGASLADEVLLCLGDWKIADKTFSFTLDNASYNDSMVASLKNFIGRKHSLVHSGECFHMRCPCHIINLVVQAGLKLIDDVVLKIRSVLKHLRHSGPKQKKFYEIARSSFGLNIGKKLRLDTPIRWNSTFTMLDRYIYFRDAIDSFVSKDVDLRVHRLSEFEWDKVDILRYDKPSKTVQWLLQKAKSSIEELKETKESPSTNGTKSTAASTSEGEVVESTIEKEIAHAMPKATRKNACCPVAKDLRKKARERARERTLKKKQVRLLSDQGRSLEEMMDLHQCHERATGPLELGEGSGSYGKDQQSQDERNPFGNAEHFTRTSSALGANWSPQMSLNYHEEDNLIPEFQFHGALWEPYGHPHVS